MSASSSGTPDLSGAPHLSSTTSMSAGDVTGLLTFVGNQIGQSENRILAAVAANAQAEAERWGRHELEHKGIDKILVNFGNHVTQEHNEDIAFEARMGPLRKILTVVTAKWRDIAILAIAVLTLLGLIDAQTHI